MRARLTDIVPAVSRVAETDPTPFAILMATLISLRTKDRVTAEVSQRLFQLVDSPRALTELSERHLAQILYPAGFYRVKARQMRAIAAYLLEHHAGEVPRTLEELLALPGVGRKTANLVLGLAFGIPAICVDTHVHRISNRLGWVATSTPEETERALMSLIPPELWIEVNEMLVRLGQTICTPISPFCSRCPISADCMRKGVVRQR